MFENAELRQAIEIQSKAYRLLRWVSGGIQKGIIHFERVHQWTTDASATAAWLREHFVNVPSNCRPAEAEGPEFDCFVNYFASYLFTSFDIDPSPAPEVKTQCGCFCPVCRYLVAGSHLKPKKVRPVDKKRAERLKEQHLEQLAMDNDIAVTDADIGALLAEPDLSRAAALCGYVAEIMRRCAGLPSGPEALALWRQFAWKLSGSPIKDFRLNSKDVLSAQSALVEAMKNRTSA